MSWYAFKMKRLFAWETLKQTIEGLGATVVLPEVDTPGRGSFVRDPVVVAPNGTVLVFKSDIEGIAEERALLLPLLKKQGFDRVAVIDANIHGGEVVFHPTKKILFFSDIHGGVTQKRDALMKERNTHGYEAIPVTVRPEHAAQFYHLDIAMMRLGKKILCCTDILEDESKKAVRRLLAPDLIEIPLKDAQNMALNGITVGRVTILPDCSPNLERIIKKEGFSVITPEKLGLPKGAFTFGKGSCHCMTLDIPSTGRGRGAEV